MRKGTLAGQHRSAAGDLRAVDSPGIAVRAGVDLPGRKSGNVGEDDGRGPGYQARIQAKSR